MAKIGLFNLNMHYIIENHRILVLLTMFDLMATNPKVKTIATLFVRAVMGRLHTGQESCDRPAAKTSKTKKLLLTFLSTMTVVAEPITTKVHTVGLN